MKTYISGQITGLPEEEAFQNFADAQTYFESLDYEVINPMLLPHNHADALFIQCLNFLKIIVSN